MSPHLTGLRVSASCQIEGLLEVVSRVVKVTTAEKCQPEINQSVDGDTFDVAILRNANRVGGQLFGALDISFVAVNKAQLKLRSGNLIVVGLVLRHLQSLLKLHLCF